MDVWSYWQIRPSVDLSGIILSEILEASYFVAVFSRILTFSWVRNPLGGQEL